MTIAGTFLGRLALGAALALSASPAQAAPTLAATRSIAFDTRSLALAGERDLILGKEAELARPMTAERAARLLLEPDARSFRREIGTMAAPKLRALAGLEPKVPERFASVLASEQQAWLEDVNQALGPFGVRADGPVKTWYSMLGKLDRNTQANLTRGRLLADGSPVPATPGELNDLTRARVNLPRLDPALLHRMVEHVQATLPQRRPLCALHFIIKDYATDAVLADPAAPYKGRVHVIIEDVTGGIKRGSFELQLGPRHLTDFWDRHFKVEGTNQDFDLHDGVYKGVGALSRPEHLMQLGRAKHPDRKLTDAEALASGRRVVQAVLAEYQRQLDLAVEQAMRGTPGLDYEATLPLRTMVGDVYRALRDQPDLPEGLRQHQHPLL